MSKEKKILPELRFPEFVSDGEWNRDEVQNLVSTITPPRKFQTSDYLDEGNFPIIDQSQSFYCGYTNDSNSIISEGLPLVIFGDHTCVLKMARKPFAQGADGIKILKSKNEITPEFIFQFLQFNGVRQENYKRHFSKLKEKKVLFPEVKTGEQQKIAACLASLDELIAAHSDKLESLKDHKKGLMQNLFPQKGQKMPKYRFPEFEKEWKKTLLTEHIDLTSGFAFKSKFFSEQGKKLVTPKNFTKEGRASFDIANTKYTTEEYDTKYLCKANDLLMLLTDLTPSCELLGKPILLKQEDGEALLNQRIVRVEINSDLDKSFLLQYFLTDYFYQWIKRTATGSTVRHSSNKIILKTELFIPQNPKEQQKIASCLSALDELITAQSEKIAQLQQHKKGMMQGLFPNTSEIR